jgi:hypothetical protein
VLVVLAAAIGLIVWLAMGQGGGGGTSAGASPSGTPAGSITPGPAPSGSTGGSNDATSGGTGASSSASASGSAGVSGGSGGSVSVSGGASGGVSGGGVPVNTGSVMALAVCQPADLALSLDTAQTVYPAGYNPVFRLTVKNSGAADCRIDVGRTASVITIRNSAGQHVWSSADCPSSRGSQWVRVSVGGSVTASYTWDRTQSQPGCPSGSTGAIAGGGTFVAQASVSGLSNQPQWQFKLVAEGS